MGNFCAKEIEPPIPRVRIRIKSNCCNNKNNNKESSIKYNKNNNAKTITEGI